LPPYKGIEYNGSRVSNEEEIEYNLFHDFYDDFCKIQIYKSDTLVKTWDGPAQSMGDTIHHFYNYDSWDVELTGTKYTLVFSILESDLE